MVRFPKFVVGMLTMVFVLGLAAPVFADSVNGTVRSVTPDRNEVTLKGILKDSTYTLDKAAWVVLDGRRVKLTDLREGDKAHIDYNKINDNMVATGVRALRSASETKGTVKLVVTDRNEILIKGTLSDTVYHLDKNANIYINTKQGNLSDIRDGEDVAVTYTTRDNMYYAAEIRVFRK